MPDRDGLDPDRIALFLDFDGTLVDIADRPGAVVLIPEVRQTLVRLHDVLQGAVAIVSGRSVADLDAFLQPLALPLAGVHGLEIRDAGGVLHRHAFDADQLARIAASIHAFAANHQGMLVETKPGAVALHYRQRPELEEAAAAFTRACADAEAGVHMVRGKMVCELRLGGRSKADAVSRFMGEPPFAGRTPWFFGDDVTDEDGFRRVNELGGRSVKIGPGDTVASARLSGTADLHRWLARLAGASRLETGHIGSAT